MITVLIATQKRVSYRKKDNYNGSCISITIHSWTRGNKTALCMLSARWSPCWSRACGFDGWLQYGWRPWLRQATHEKEKVSFQRKRRHDYIKFGIWHIQQYSVPIVRGVSLRSFVFRFDIEIVRGDWWVFGLFFRYFFSEFKIVTFWLSLWRHVARSSAPLVFYFRFAAVWIESPPVSNAAECFLSHRNISEKMSHRVSGCKWVSPATYTTAAAATSAGNRWP